MNHLLCDLRIIISVILFCLAMPNFSLLFPHVLAVGKWISETAIDMVAKLQRVINLESGKETFFSFKKLLLAISCGVENPRSGMSKRVRLIRDLFMNYDQRKRVFNKYAKLMGVAAQFNSIAPRPMMIVIVSKKLHRFQPFLGGMENTKYG